MKAVRFELKIIHKKEIVIGSVDRSRINEVLKTVLESGEELDVTKDELLGVIVEEKEERNCQGVCEHCDYLCPKEEDCMLDDLKNRCVECEHHCQECGNCTMKDSGTCGEECEKCHWRCEKCGSCAHPQGEKLP